MSAADQVEDHGWTWLADRLVIWAYVSTSWDTGALLTCEVAGTTDDSGPGYLGVSCDVAWPEWVPADVRELLAGDAADAVSSWLLGLVDHGCTYTDEPALTAWPEQQRDDHNERRAS